MHPQTDPELVALWQRGFHDAYAILVARHYGVVLAACQRQAPPGEAEDCAQAVFLVLSRRADAAAKAPVLAAWLMKVTGFVCRNACRASQRRRRAEASAAAIHDGHAHVDDARPEALDHLDQCLMHLPVRQRNALTLHFLAGKNADEVAASLQTTRDNAYQLISRGLAALRVLLAKRGVAVSSVALTSILSAEASAATIQPPAAVLASLTTAPSSSVLSLAQGAMTTMTISTITPFAGAGLAVASLMLGVSLAAEDQGATPAPTSAPMTQSTPTTASPTTAAPDPSRAPANTPTPNARPQPLLTRDAVTASSLPTPVSGNGLGTPDDSNQVPLAVHLQQKITITFEDTPVAECVSMLNAVTGPNRIQLAEGNGGKLPNVTLQAADQTVAQVLKTIELLTGLSHVEQRGIYVLQVARSAGGAANP